MKFLQYFEPVLVALKELGGSGTPYQVRERVVVLLAISEEEQNETLKDGTRLRYHTNIAFARQYLVWEGYLSGSEYGIWSLTEVGRSVQSISIEEAKHIFKTQYEKHVRSRQPARVHRLAEEVPECQTYPEGAVIRVLINRYERDRKARQQCIRLYGSRCCICDFDFEQVYGEIGRGLIHVHHMLLLSEVGAGYKVNPKEDMRPICPNCHAIVHSRKPPLHPEEVRQLLDKAKVTVHE